MKIIKEAIAGTLESNDIMVTMRPSSNGIIIDLTSIVKAQFGEEIEKTIRDVCKENGVDNAQFIINDRGALDCTIRARIETAIMRGAK